MRPAAGRQRPVGRARCILACAVFASSVPLAAPASSQTVQDPDATRGGATDLGDVMALGPSNVGRWRDSVDGNEDVTDYFSFTLTSERLVGIGLRFQDANADIFLEDGAANVLASSRTNGVRQELLVKRLNSGTYYIRVEAREARANDYELFMGTSRPQASDPTSDFDTTARVAEGSCFEANDGARIGPYWDIDWVGVDLVADVSYVLEVRGRDSGSGGCCETPS